ncbi:hypothetical protein LOTGIDRAFT_143482 [Lottia gigantea]|uniref:Polysaccharide lyase 14 domain-containing protein n=1 Tax=Lottia gigantea TaxID=225164 RepID=V4AQL7_LOTGI|nr:hypothetical protein LOTGIDRAFT_143482 [Lottia gigantea]ESO97120.1 hypothetical protein LOTGIDRAFT_143482 [Lottia gigantea]
MRTFSISDILWHKNTFNSQNIHDGFHAIPNLQYNEGSLSVVKDPAGGHGDVIRIYIKKGHYNGIHDHRGAQFYTKVGSPRDSMTLTYDVYFQKGLDFVKGGKLPGLYGGDPGCSGGRHSHDCLSTRFMWRPHGDGEMYAYMPADQANGFCDKKGNDCNDAYGISIGRGSWRFRTGQWDTISQHIHLNSPGHKDGYAIVWHNGKKVLDVRNVNFREHSNLKLEGLYFSVFFGGGSSAWAPTADSHIYFRNFIISKESHLPHLVG